MKSGVQGADQKCLDEVRGTEDRTGCLDEVIGTEDRTGCLDEVRGTGERTGVSRYSQRYRGQDRVSG